MPYPNRIDRETTIATARALIEAHGVEWLSLGKLAEQMGVRAPSLYRYFDSRSALLKAVSESVLAEMTTLLYAVPQHPISEAYFTELAVTWWTFARGMPHSYMLLYGSQEQAARPDPDLNLALALRMQGVIAEVSEPENALAALRGLFSLIHGWAILEISGQFQRGGDLEAHFRQAVGAYIRGWKLRE